MPATTLLPEYTPPSLGYLVIYNPTLTPIQINAGEDEDDAIEQAHILFYTARDRAVRRDVMLRQVGLAKALTNFSEMFTVEGLDTVHSQKRRMIILRPEPDFWIVASVDVSKAPKQPASTGTIRGKSKSKTSSKSEDKKKAAPTSASSDGLEYKENALFDDVLKTQLQRAYDEFTLLHGQLQTLLDASSRSSLEKALERFFTPWAWKWDVDVLSSQAPPEASSSDTEGPNFAQYLGLPLHPSSKAPESATILDKIYDEAPSPTMPFVLCVRPPSVFPAPSRPTAPPLPQALPRYLLATIPPPPRERRPSAASIATLRQPTSKGAHPTEANSSFNDFAAGFPSIPPLPKMHLNLGNVTNGVVNPKKWSWPGYLTFGRSGASSVAGSRDASPSRQAATKAEKPLEGEEDPLVPTEEGSAEERGEESRPEPPPVAEGSEEPSSQDPPSEPPVDQELLQDAIKNAAEGIDGPRVEVDLESTASSTEEPVSTPIVEPSEDADASTIAGKTPKPGVVAFPEPEPEPELGDTPSAEAKEPRTAIAPPFTTVTVHLRKTEADASIFPAKLSYLVRGRFVFGMVHRQDSLEEQSTSPKSSLNETVSELLDELADAVDKFDLQSENKLTGRAQASDTTESGTSARYVTFDPFTETSTNSSGYEASSPHFFAARHLLTTSSSSNISEVFVRANSLQWFAAKRKGEQQQPSSSDSTVDSPGSRREVYAEVGRRDASLVDVDNEVNGI